PRERPVDAAERLGADEVAPNEGVERDLEPPLTVDRASGMCAGARLVVLDDPPGAERVEIDPVDLSGEREAVPEREAALQLGRRSLRAERDLELTRDELHLRFGFVADEALEVGEERLAQLGSLQRLQVEPHTGLERGVETSAHEVKRSTDVFGSHPLGVELPREHGVEAAERRVHHLSAQESVRREERAQVRPERARLARDALVVRRLPNEHQSAASAGARRVEEVAVAGDRVRTLEPAAQLPPPVVVEERGGPVSSRKAPFLEA